MAWINSLKTKKWTVPAAHFLVWLLFFSIPFFSSGEHKPPPFHEMHRPMHHNRDEMRYLTLMTNTVLVVIFYLNIFFLAPIFTQQKKYGRYLLIQLATVSGFYLLLRSITKLLAFDRHMPFGFQLFSYMIVVLGSLCYGLISEHMKAERIQKEKENERLNAELTFLRWQISPHFLFNVLNNMVSLARVRSEKLEGMLFNLSNLMRYMIYENDGRKISIEREMEYLKSYVLLQNMRFGHEVKVESTMEVAEDAGDEDAIEPMLVIPFIENAYKHGIGLITEPMIFITIQFSGNTFTMTVKNKYRLPSDLIDTKDETKGIGLANVKRRLNLLYPDKHSLTIAKEDGWYSSTLEINIS